MRNMVSLTYSSLQILDKTQTGLFPISGFLAKSLISKSCHNSRISNNIDKKLELVPKIDKKVRQRSKNFDDIVVSTNYDAIVFF